MSKRQTTQHVMLSLSEKARQKHSSYKSDISKTTFHKSLNVFHKTYLNVIQTFANSNLKLRDEAAVDQGSDHAPEPPVAGPIQTVHAAAALVLLLGADRAAPADARHHGPLTLLRFLAFRLVARQA